MVDDPNAPQTDDSVIESYDVLLDGEAVETCVLPDWRAVYCCTLSAPREARTVTLAAKTCRERADGPGNTGFKTVEVYAAEAADEVVDSVTLVGSDNVVDGAASHTFVAGSDGLASASDAATATGHAVRVLSSDESTALGVDVAVEFSDRAVAIGHNVSMSNADDAVAIGSHLSAIAPTQVVLGSHNAPSAAKLVVGGGSAATPRNLLEAHADGSLENAHVARLEARVANLEAALLACGDASCAELKVSYRVAGCCQSA